uniref:Lactamase_B domain-containing protein n=1 Tax=Steinernema glaseri TaxID=37863 RepID=A0A1I7ZZW7_9BILA
MSTAFCGVLLLLCVSATAQQSALNLKIFVQQPTPPSVTQLVEGQLRNIQDGSMLVASSTLVQDGGYHIVVDTPTATDIQSKEKMLSGLVAKNVMPGQVQMVVTTHGHPDHFGQLNFFPNARHFFGSYEYSNNNFIKTELQQAQAMALTRNIELWNTPGHTAQDVSVVVRNVPCCGTVAVVGDLFYSEADVANHTEWYLDAWNPKIGLQHRNRIICCVDWIVPGHGKMFRVTQAMRQRANCTGGYLPAPVPTVPTTVPPTTTVQPTWTWTWTPTSTTTTTPSPSTVPSTTTSTTTTTAAPTTTTTVPTTTATSKYVTVDYNWNNSEWAGESTVVHSCLDLNDVPTETTKAPTTTQVPTTTIRAQPIPVIRPVPHAGISYVAAPPTHLQYLAPCTIATVHPCPPAFVSAPAANHLLVPVLQQLVDYVERPGTPAPPQGGYLQLLGRAFRKFAGEHLTDEVPKKAN